MFNLQKVWMKKKIIFHYILALPLRPLDMSLVPQRQVWKFDGVHVCNATNEATETDTILGYIYCHSRRFWALFFLWVPPIFSPPHITFVCKLKLQNPRTKIAIKSGHYFLPAKPNCRAGTLFGTIIQLVDANKVYFN